MTKQTVSEAFECVSNYAAATPLSLREILDHLEAGTVLVTSEGRVAMSASTAEDMFGPDLQQEDLPDTIEIIDLNELRDSNGISI